MGRLLALNDWNPSATVKFGETRSAQLAYGEELLGEIIVSPKGGHDGQFFFSQAMDPFYLEPMYMHISRPTGL